MKTWYSIQASAAQGDAGVAEVSIFDDIGAWGITAKDFLDEALALSASTIKVFINSPGGSVFDALTMLNGLKAKGKRIESTVLGMAASAASVFAVGSDKVSMPANTFQFVHNPITGCYGNAEDMRKQADALDLVGSSIRAMYARRWKGTDEELTAALADESYFTAEACLANGLCDEVIDEVPIKAKFDPERVPEALRPKFLATEPPKPEPEPAPVITVPEATPIANAIKDAATAAGLGDFAAMWALKFDNVTDVTAAIVTAREVQALCAVAGRPDDAAALIRASKPLADVRTELCAALEAQAQQTHVSNVSTTKSEPRDPSPVQIDPAQVYARVNQYVNRG